MPELPWYLMMKNIMATESTEEHGNTIKDMFHDYFVIPAQAGIQNCLYILHWIPALRRAPAGMTNQSKFH